MPGGRLTARERVLRNLGLARRLGRAVTQRVRRRGGGEVEAERPGDVVREAARRIGRRRRR